MVERESNLLEALPTEVDPQGDSDPRYRKDNPRLWLEYLVGHAERCHVEAVPKVVVVPERLRETFGVVLPEALTALPTEVDPQGDSDPRYRKDNPDCSLNIWLGMRNDVTLKLCQKL
jgi:hypothetical protein